MADEKRRLTGIDEVVDEEIKIITKRRKRLYPDREVSGGTRTSLIGLAFSGGGIRSAVTCLGVLYEMSRVGLFNVVDYLSTVSGGGYIGCCVASLLSLKKPGAAQATKGPYAYDDGSSDPSLFSAGWNSFPFRDLPMDEVKSSQDDKVTPSHPGKILPEYGDDGPFCKKFSSRDQVFHLRNRASYLIPSSLPFGSYVTRALGAVSASTLLSLLWFFSLIVLLTTVYMGIVFSGWTMKEAAIRPVISSAVVQTQDKNMGLKATDESLINAAMKKASLAMRNVKKRLTGQAAEFSVFPATPLSQWFVRIVLMTGILWGLIVPSCIHWWGQKRRRDDIRGENRENYLARKQLKLVSLITIVLLFVVLFTSFILLPVKFFHPDPRLLLPVVFAGSSIVGSLVRLCLMAWLPCLSWTRISRSEVALCTGIFLYCLAGSCIFAFLPAFILSGNSGFIALIQAVFILVLRFYFSGEKKKTGIQKEGGFKVFIDKIGRWLMGILVPVVVLLAVVGVAAYLGDVFFGHAWPKTVGPADYTALTLVLSGSLLLASLLSALNFNNISPHVFYKDRLAEAFLETLMHEKSNNNKTGDFITWMDLARNAVEMDLVDLHGHDLKNGSGSDSAARGPYLLINATLNLTAARDLDGFRRQSENFLFSRCYTGSQRTGYLMTSDYNPPIELGRAMTISGAAVTSVMGANGSLAESFACTILGIRLGYWLRNPIDMAATGKIRKWNWKNLYYELIRYTNSRDSHVYLSDGGHCGDNLGLLALLQRHTKLIITSDAECDPDHVFDSLNNSIRRAYVDYNIKVHISLDDLMPDDKGLTKKHFTIGRIIYPDRPWQKSWLLVIKNTITGRESPPILNYWKKSPSFPHEITADQFFTEEQFEVYRSLGREACMEIWRHNTDIFRSEKWLRDPWSCIDAFCRDLAGKDNRWSDVIRAIWSSEKGDFATWKGFCETVNGYVREMEKLKLHDESTMVKQLHILDKWLQENKTQFPQLQGKFDIPRTWAQFKEIGKHLATSPEHHEQGEETSPDTDART